MDVKPSSSSQPPHFREATRSAPHSSRVIFTPSWFSSGGVISEKLRIPFSIQIKGLDYLSIEIGFMEYGIELWKAVHRLISMSSLDELIQLPELLGQTATRLTTFGSS
ncbi:hypothetical protein AMTR_s00070p00087120 [Amborella trichopoda]|uniref:Uncharacterized protein n=1 Tax=Amborella trichopoda TaxID=13333 RepID=U5DEG5_AMBTC|nr:hypothetical protein AMTR_s00070p00087120 [Amborella trichopoda]